MNISSQEIDVMFKKNAKERYVYFVKKIADWECAWALGDDTGYITTEDGDGNLSLPLWPAKEYAQKCAVNEWTNLSVKEVSLDELLDELLPELIEDEIDVVAFMAPDETGLPTLSAANVLKDLLAECEKYE
ncbi:DUF2750 domain-containing protein [Cronobacter turicensis]|uniref:DUF2750 domain-containing protein n=2 Tax=Cronobacter turicensis TaxID=413502 RepID=A0A2T7AUR4_9ENTR|nr:MULTISPECIES: DUF2750 domain-containing protein [Cronobacter]MEB8541025.1 DUF2750 domain-containing protein [Cronobacter sakazakii]EGT5684023.1 DUF2750 domain-containing protein [Cronobacter turicensis]EGT5742651.1 DUF2750 domain-containing protein [Cronobacter turicensis]EKM0374277.1 DUF2750 domain-containing protein [Cronobacter turicensis]EKM0527683.1 DUF2750 domain-containing protein [Cronobacter turicensis]